MTTQVQAGNPLPSAAPIPEPPNMYAPLLNMAFLIGLNQVVKYFNLTSAAYNVYIRTIFAVAQATILTILLLISNRIGSINYRDTVEVIEPAPAFSGEPPKRKQMTAAEYDKAELSKQIRSFAFQVLISAGIHYYFKSSHILIINSVIPLKTLLTSPLFKIYFMGNLAKGALSRPFREAPSVLTELLKQMEEPAAPPAPAVTVQPPRATALSDLSDSSDDEHPLLPKRPVEDANSRMNASSRIKVLDDEDDKEEASSDAKSESGARKRNKK